MPKQVGLTCPALSVCMVSRGATLPHTKRVPFVVSAAAILDERPSSPGSALERAVRPLGTGQEGFQLSRA